LLTGDDDDDDDDNNNNMYMVLRYQKLTSSF
jgi:hypothetical protein